MIYYTSDNIHDAGDTDAHWYTDTDSPVGLLGLVATNQGLRAVLWRDEINSVKLPDDMTENPSHPVLKRAARQIAEYFAEKRISFNLPLDLRGTPFQMAVWQSLGDISYGSTLSYSEHAALIARPKAVRAVARANGCNPVPIVLPCHRVIGADGSLTGFGGGLDTKSYLLHHEGALD